MRLFDFMEYKQATWKDQVRRSCATEENKEKAYIAIDNYFNRVNFDADVNCDISHFECIRSFKIRHELSEEEGLVDIPCGLTCPFCARYENWCSHCAYNTYYGCAPMSPYSDMVMAIEKVNVDIKDVKRGWNR